MFYVMWNNFSKVYYMDKNQNNYMVKKNYIYNTIDWIKLISFKLIMSFTRIKYNTLEEEYWKMMMSVYREKKINLEK